MISKGIIKVLNINSKTLYFGRFLVPKFLFSTNSPHQISKSDESKKLPSTSVSVKVKEGIKDASYSLVVIGGVLFTGIGMYYIFRELLSSEGPQAIYDNAYKLCAENEKVINLIGGNIKAYGETDRRGRRRHTAHEEWVDALGRTQFVMRFYIEGTLGKATVMLQMQKKKNEKYEYVGLVVETAYPHRKIVLINNMDDGSLEK